MLAASKDKGRPLPLTRGPTYTEIVLDLARQTTSNKQETPLNRNGSLDHPSKRFSSSPTGKSAITAHNIQPSVFFFFFYGLYIRRRAITREFPRKDSSLREEFRIPIGKFHVALKGKHTSFGNTKQFHCTASRHGQTFRTLVDEITFGRWKTAWNSITLNASIASIQMESLRE